MEFLVNFHALSLVIGFFFLFMLWRALCCYRIMPNLAYHKLKRSGFRGPTPSFPLGNLSEMMRDKIGNNSSLSPSPNITHDFHSTLFPYFAKWQKFYGKVFMYWLGTEPFVYIADPEFLKQMSKGIMGKSWGKPTVFKNDRKPMFGKGLVMAEGQDWLLHRHVITQAFSPSNLKDMASLMAESTTAMLDRWTSLISSSSLEIDAEREITTMAGEVIAKAIFGISCESGKRVIEKITAVQVALFKSNRFVGVPYSSLIMCPKQTLQAKMIGNQINALLRSIIKDRREKLINDHKNIPQKDLLGILLAGHLLEGKRGKKLTTRELVDECKTFFFAGQETSALLLMWTMMLLAIYPEWQDHLREEIKQVVGDGEVDPTMLAGLKKMGWVMNEVLRLYSPAPNLQRQAREMIKVSDGVVIPKGTNIWIDVISLHHDRDLWGNDVYEFRPERFKDDHLYGGCKHKMGFLPFGFGGRICVGRNFTLMEYKIALTLILKKFSLSLSPGYCHSPSTLLTLRPTHGLPLILHPL
ncbi:Cytokinin hydroxylase [Actinidia chinensis var. chinensis]|uniref:Cytokinin hydroxylase n=1 Tax=Actinidia chinensis var. chinensis TaxID=1590841 RepID=A0A2R6RSQ5_ACTCC|nr:Cytokinin hydroxylase [Actinidia chinensis var. chinensis]